VREFSSICHLVDLDGAKAKENHKCIRFRRNLQSGLVELLTLVEEFQANEEIERAFEFRSNSSGLVGSIAVKECQVYFKNDRKHGTARIISLRADAKDRK